MEQENKYTNKVANKFSKWSDKIAITGVVILIIGIIATLSLLEEEFCLLIFISTIISFGFCYINCLFIGAIAEIIQKLQNIEDNIR